MGDKRSRWLWILTAANLGLYVLLALRYPLAPSLEQPRASWASLVAPTGLNAVWHLGIYAGLILVFMAILQLLYLAQRESPAQPRRQIFSIVATWLACSAVLMSASPAGESHDIFDYLFRGRMLVEYQANPLVDTPDEFSLATPYARYLAWYKNVDTYGPVWEASSAAISASVRQVAHWLGWWNASDPVCPNSFESCRLLMAYITAYRLMAVILTGLSGWLIFSITNRNHPSLAALSLAAWLLCPITLLSTALGGHNDSVMLVLVLLSWWLLQRNRPYLAVMALILAAHVKLTALIWLPTCLLWIYWRWGWKSALKVSMVAILSGLALSWLMYAPFGGWQSIPRMLHERSAYLANSPWRIFKQVLIDPWGWQVERAHQLSISLSSVLSAAAAILIPVWIFNFRPKRWRIGSLAQGFEEQKLWQALAAISLVYLLVGSFWFQPWYVMWVVAPAALLPSSPVTRMVLPWLAFGAMSSNVAVDFYINSASNTIPGPWIYTFTVLVIWGPAMLAFLIMAFIRLFKRLRPLGAIQTQYADN